VRLRPTLVAWGALLALCAVPAAANGAHATPAGTAKPATAIGLGMREYRITVYRPKVKIGTAKFLITNRGEDAHNLRVKGPGGYRSSLSADAAPAGGHATLRARLRRAGTYVLYCAKPGHAKLGMRATLRVVPR
jgi:plastocyanin